jgi:hypothetical protein
MSPALLLMLLTTGGALSAVDTVVVCGDELRPAMASWVEYRQAQGREIAFVPPRATAAETHARVLEVCDREPVRFVVLVGDATTTGSARHRTPTFSIPARVNIHWGPETELASDSGYAQVDGDHVPDLAVGRLSADTPAELATMIQKIIAYEQCPNDAGWRRKVNFIAGVGGFGAVADTLLELSAKRLITSGIPAGYSTSMTHASWRSPYCPEPRQFNTTVLERLNEGCLFWVYFGHGQSRHLDRLYTPPNARYEILHANDVHAMHSRHGAPIALFLSCYAGAYDNADDCLAEEMLSAPNGPVAVAASSRVSMPYGMTVLGTNLLKSCFTDRAQTLGELFLAANRRTLTDKRDDPEAKMLDSLAEKLNPASTSAADERAETTQVFNLLGDPLLRIAHPESLPLTAPDEAFAGETIKIHGAAPFAGRCKLELIVRRDRLTFRAPTRREYDASPEAEMAYQEIYLRANDPRLVTREVDVSAGKFTVTLEVPENSTGDCHIRAAIDGREQFALGAHDLTIVRRPKVDDGVGESKTTRPTQTR